METIEVLENTDDQMIKFHILLKNDYLLMNTP